MDERDPQSTPAQAEPMRALPTVDPTSPKKAKSGKSSGLLLGAIITVLALILAVLALVLTTRGTGGGFVGSWAAGSQSLEIRADGEARGTDGCNGQSSSWSQAGDRIVFSGFMGTLMACMGPGDRMLNGWLGQSASAELDPTDSNRLNFFDQADGFLGSMVRNGAVEPLPQEPIMPTGDPYFPGPIDPSDPLPGRPDPRPMYPDLPDDPRTDQGESAPKKFGGPLTRDTPDSPRTGAEKGTTP